MSRAPSLLCFEASCGCSHRASSRCPLFAKPRDLETERHTPMTRRDNVAGAMEFGFRRSVLIDERCFTRSHWEDVKGGLGLEDFV